MSGSRCSSASDLLSLLWPRNGFRPESLPFPSEGAPTPEVGSTWFGAGGCFLGTTRYVNGHRFASPSPSGPSSLPLGWEVDASSMPIPCTPGLRLAPYVLSYRLAVSTAQFDVVIRQSAKDGSRIPEFPFAGRGGWGGGLLGCVTSQSGPKRSAVPRATLWNRGNESCRRPNWQACQSPVVHRTRTSPRARPCWHSVSRTSA